VATDAVVVALVSDEPETVAAADVVVADDAERGRIEATVAANPQASLALALLLRESEDRSVADGLLAESATYSALQAGPEFGRWLVDRGPRTPSAAVEGRDLVRMERDGDLLRLTLDRPEVHNAFSAAVREALLDGLAVATAVPELRVVVDGAGPSFCSGGDLDEFGTASDPATAHLVRLSRSVGRAVADLAGRVTFRVHGACVGAGVELPAFAGRVVAAPDTRFRLPEVAMGLVPGAGGTVSIPKRVGRQRTAWLALTGDWIDAPTALDWGLVDEVS
jgi:enoyl-CoA hydratase/carnithine racemase